MKNDPYAERESGRYVVSRDGVEYYSSDDYNRCLGWLQGNVPYSWDHAVRNEGWQIHDRYKATGD